MPKVTQIFVCSNCASQFSKWQGQCSECGKWNTLFEESIIKSTTSNNSPLNSPLKIINSTDIKSHSYTRYSSNITEFDRVLGGGFVPGQVILLAGSPGIGKSTLLLQLANYYKKSIYYICGEESPAQVKQRMDRLKINSNNLFFIENTDIETINHSISNISDSLIILDSINSSFSSKYKSYPGSISNIRECSQLLTNTAKKNNLNLILVGQINKDGDIAGPKSLEHIVDTVLNLEGDSNYSFRVLRSQKNRYGSINETGIFLMTEKGMEPIDNPSKYLLIGKVAGASGSSVCMSLEGTRCMAVEVQALCVKSSFGFPKRVSSGYSLNRLNLICAIIEKRINLPISQYDVYVNIASGLSLKEPASDLAVCASIVSSIKNRPIKNGSSFFGEVGLNGEVRPVTMSSVRVKESEKLKFPNTFYNKTISNITDLINNSLV